MLNIFVIKLLTSEEAMYIYARNNRRDLVRDEISAVGSFQRHASVRADTGGTLVRRRHGGDSRDPVETGLPGSGLLLVRTARRTSEYARSAVHPGIHHLRRSGKGRRAQDRTPTDGESESGPHQCDKEKRRSQGICCPYILKKKNIRPALISLI